MVEHFNLLGTNGFDQEVLSKTTDEGYTSIRAHNNRLGETTEVKLDPSESEQLYYQLDDHFGYHNNE